jgi:hypothetical protein
LNELLNDDLTHSGTRIAEFHSVVVTSCMAYRAPARAR